MFCCKKLKCQNFGSLELISSKLIRTTVAYSPMLKCQLCGLALLWFPAPCQPPNNTLISTCLIQLLQYQSQCCWMDKLMQPIHWILFTIVSILYWKSLISVECFSSWGDCQTCTNESPFCGWCLPVGGCLPAQYCQEGQLWLNNDCPSKNMFLAFPIYFLSDITGINPSYGLVEGGTVVQISGTYFIDPYKYCSVFMTHDRPEISSAKLEVLLLRQLSNPRISSHVSRPQFQISNKQKWS